MKSLLSQEYRLPFGIAIGLHVVLLVLLCFKGFSMSTPPKQIEIVAGEPPVMTAKAVSQKEVAAEIKRLENVEQERQEKIHAEQEKIRLEKEQAEKEREQAILEIAQAKKQKEELAKKAEAEKKRLEELKQKQAELKRKEEAKKKEEAKLKAEQEKKLTEQKKAKEEAEKKKKAEVAAKEAAEKKKAAELAAKEKADREALEAQEGERVHSEVMRYQALITQKIRQNWLVQGNVRANMQGKLQIRLAPGGGILDVRVLASSGDEMLDRSAVNAVYRSAPLPVSLDQKVFNELRDITWVFKPADSLSASR